MKHQARLLLLGLDRNNAHGRQADFLANRSGIGRVILLTANVRLHVSWRDQALIVAPTAQDAAPIMSAAARLHSYKAGWQLLKESRDIEPLEGLLQHDLTRRVDRVNLKNARENNSAETPS